MFKTQESSRDNTSHPSKALVSFGPSTVLDIQMAVGVRLSIAKETTYVE